MDFHYDASGVDEGAPLLYLWTIHDTTDRVLYCYVGKANGGAKRPKKIYASVVRRLLRGRPYRPNNPTYRVIHQRMAEAIKLGFTIRLRLIRNVPLNEDIFAAETAARAQFSALYGMTCG